MRRSMALVMAAGALAGAVGRIATISRRRGSRRTAGATTSREGTLQSEKRPTRPSHFLSLRVREEAAKEAIETAQNQLIEQDSRLRGACVPSEAAHFTLCVLYLVDGEELNQAAAAMRRACESFREEGSLRPSLDHVGSLGQGKVAYLGIEEGQESERLHMFAERVREELGKVGLLEEQHPFRPHLTVMKLSQLKKARKKHKGSKNDGNNPKIRIPVEHGAQLSIPIQLDLNECEVRATFPYY